MYYIVLLPFVGKNDPITVHVYIHTYVLLVSTCRCIQQSPSLVKKNTRPKKSVSISIHTHELFSCILKVNEKLIRKTAELAQLHLEDGEVGKLVTRFDSFLKFVDAMQKVDTTGKAGKETLVVFGSLVGRVLGIVSEDIMYTRNLLLRFYRVRSSE